jgi:hypothetical protein
MSSNTSLVLDVAAITELVNLHCERVLCVHINKRADVKLRWISRPLRISNFFPVHPDMERRIHTLESQSQLMTLECFWNCENSNIASSPIIIIRDMRWIDWERVDHIRIARKLAIDLNFQFKDILRSFPIALQLPHARNIDLPPFSCIVFLLKEVCGRIEWAFGKTEFPGSRKR